MEPSILHVYDKYHSNMEPQCNVLSHHNALLTTPQVTLKQLLEGNKY